MINAISKRLLILIIGLAILVRIAAAIYLGNRIDYLPAIADQVSYHTLAERVLEGNGFTFGVDWWPATKAGQPTAHWSYLYTFYLIAVYNIFGENPIAARLIQAILSGLLMPWLAYRITRHVFHEKFKHDSQSKKERFAKVASLSRYWQESQEIIPLIAAAWVAFYGYFIYFAAALMTETFYLIGILWTLDSSLRIRSHIGDVTPQYQKPLRQQKIRTISMWIELGVAIAVTAMLRQVFLPFVPFLFLWLWYVLYQHEFRVSLATGSAIKNATKTIIQRGWVSIAVIALLIAPITLFNYYRFGRFVLLNTNAGYAFYWANHPVYENDYIPILTDDMPDYYDLLPAEVLWMDEAALEKELLWRGVGFVMDDPIRYFRLTLDRIPAYFMFWPLVSSSLVSNITRVFSYGIALPFIVVGIFLWIGDVRRRLVKIEPGLLLLLFAFIYSIVHLLSWAGVRYRLPVDVVTLVFAARSLYALGITVLFKK